jgi:hypothetical protein
MGLDIDEFHHELFQDVISSADTGGHYVEDAFFDYFCEYLIDAGELETGDRVQYLGPRGLRVDGYGGDPLNAEGVLSLIVTDFSQSPDVTTLTASDMDAIFSRLFNFLSRTRDASFRNGLEETSPVFGLADLIAQRWPGILKVRLFLVSNRVLSSRVDGRDAGELAGVPVTYSVWDLSRLHRFRTAGSGREDILIDLANDFGGPIPALSAQVSDADYEAYMLVVPGVQLAAIYDRWGPRLLERNVRVFLQARGSVNKGIRNTIDNEPDMFFAYNNGVTATAEAVETQRDGDGLAVTLLRNFQIVNGGQTTASIHAAGRRKSVDLSSVFVQMKLCVVDRTQAMDVVPRISEYANSQNRINAADFFANHPFHVRMQDFSRRIFAPSPDGTFRESKWFYERARGQYQDARALLSNAQKRRFDLEYLRTQLISKTDLAKVLNAWSGHPDIVSRGSQKNFGEFARGIGTEWTDHPDTFNETYYRHAIAMAIVFRETERLVSEQDWYQGGGIRSRVVPYAIAKLAHDAEARGGYIDFERIWRAQALPDDLRLALTVVSKAVHDVIVDSAAENPNPLEWAKQPACWSRVRTLGVDWPAGWLDTLLTSVQERERRRAGVKDQRVLNGIEAQTVVVGAGGEFWRRAKEYGATRELLTPTEASILDVAASVPVRIPSERQSLRAIATLRKLHGEGFQEGRDQV